MSDAMSTALPPSVERWRGEFMTAAERHATRRRSPLRRLLALLPAIIVLGTAGVATAALDQFESPDVPPYAGETHAYLNLSTGLPIRCPDGNLLTYTPPADNPVYGTPRCSDGSVPTIYTEQRQALLESTAHAEFGTPIAEAPRFDYAVAGN